MHTQQPVLCFWVRRQRGNTRHSLARPALRPPGRLTTWAAIGAVLLMPSLTSAATLTKLQDAITAGDGEAVTELLDETPSLLTSRDVGRETPLHFAARGGEAAIVEILLQRGADPDATGQTGQTPLHLAVLNRGVRNYLRKRLRGDDKTLNRPWGGSRQERWHGVSSPDCCTGKTPLDYAVRGKVDSVRFVKLLLSEGADPHRVSSTDEFNTLLHAASEEGTVEMVGWLIGYGQDVNAKTQAGYTPLHRDVARPQSVVNGRTLLESALEAARNTRTPTGTDFGLFGEDVVCSERAALVVARSTGVDLIQKRMGPITVHPSDFFDDDKLGWYFLVNPMMD